MDGDGPGGFGVLSFIVVYHFGSGGKHFTEVKVVMGGGYHDYAASRGSAV